MSLEQITLLMLLVCVGCFGAGFAISYHFTPKPTGTETLIDAHNFERGLPNWAQNILLWTSAACIISGGLFSLLFIIWVASLAKSLL